MVKVFSKNKEGSAAIILSLMVSAGVLSTIYFTQKMTGGFLSEHSQSIEEWEKHLVTESAQTLAAYLVANNLILCRQDGWTGKQSNCKWTLAPKTESPADFHLSDEGDSAEGLSYKGKYTLDDVEKEYKVTFQLVDWRSTSIENLIGDVPEAVCRDKNTLEVISDASCLKYEDSTDPINQVCQVSGSDDSDTLCEYIKPVDGDYWIVLTKVEVDYKDPVSKADLKHVALSGIRRPLSSIKFGMIVSGRKCSLSCPGGVQANSFTQCRGSFLPTEAGEYTGTASNIVSIKNEGPGAIYSLSLLRESVGLTGIQDSYEEDVTSDIVKEAKSTEQVFLPNETITFEYFYDCPVEVRRSIVYKTGDQDRVEVTSTTKDVPFEQFSYSLSFDADDPAGVCYKTEASPDLPDKTHEDVDFVTMSSPRLASASCTLGDTACSAGGSTGSCKFAGLEPARTFIIPLEVTAQHLGLVKEIVTTITKKEVPMIITNVTDGGSCCSGCSGNPHNGSFRDRCDGRNGPGYSGGGSSGGGSSGGGSSGGGSSGGGSSGGGSSGGGSSGGGSSGGGSSGGGSSGGGYGGPW